MYYEKSNDGKCYELILKSEKQMTLHNIHQELRS